MGLLFCCCCCFLRRWATLSECCTSTRKDTHRPAEHHGYSGRWLPRADRKWWRKIRVTDPGLEFRMGDFSEARRALHGRWTVRTLTRTHRRRAKSCSVFWAVLVRGANGGRGGSTDKTSAPRSNGFHVQRFESRTEHKNNLWQFFPSQHVVLTRCRCAPPPCAYARIRTYARLRSFGPCQSSVDYGNTNVPWIALVQEHYQIKSNQIKWSHVISKPGIEEKEARLNKREISLHQ